MPLNHQQFSKDLKIQKANHVQGQEVDHELLKKYRQDLEKATFDQLNDDKAKKAFWINVYNGITNLFVIGKNIKKTMLERPLLFGFAKINIGGYRFSLDDIEHGLLRKNRRAMHKVFPPFWCWDKRRKLMVDRLDYRIHFALNCGAKSCPPIAFYDADKIEEQLRLAEANFVEQAFLVDHEKQTIDCSRIFRLYKKDFKEVYINDPAYRQYTINYRKYDFSIS